MGLSDFFEVESSSRDPLNPDYFFSVGRNNACIYDDDKRLKCWGKDEQGLLDVPSIGDEGIKDLDVGFTQICFVGAEDGVVTCWGTGSNKPTNDIGNRIVSVGDFHICSASRGQVRCKGQPSSIEGDAPRPFITTVEEFQMLSSGGLSCLCA